MTPARIGRRVSSITYLLQREGDTVRQSTEPAPLASNDRPRLGIFDPEAGPSAVAAAPLAANLTPALTPRPRAKRKSKTDRDFPLWQRKDGRWCRKINRRVHYFGTDRGEALEEWLRVKDDLLAGRTPREPAEGLTIVDLCDAFLVAKQMLVDSGELSRRTFADYKHTTDRLVAVFGRTRPVDDLAPSDFDDLRRELAKTRGIVGIANAIRMTRIVFKYAVDADLTERPIRFGPMFRVKRDKIRKASAGRAPRMFDANQLRAILKASDDTMKAMVLLGMNCGFGQTDIANLPRTAIDLKRGWVNFPRIKTGAPRRIPLWPETIAGIRKAIEARPVPKDAADADMVFITKYGRRWTRTTAKGGPIDGVAQEFAKLLRNLKLKRAGLGFYALRHTHATVSSGACDQIVTNAIMGHLPASDDMPGRYREHIADERLRKVTEHVRRWLFPSKRSAK